LMAFDVSFDTARVDNSVAYRTTQEQPDGSSVPAQYVAPEDGSNARLFEARYDARLLRYDVESRLPSAQPVAHNAPQDQAALDDEKRELLLDITQIGLSIVGIFEPTPFADGADGIISLFRGDFLGAGISAASMIPYVGDLAKLGKLPKFVKIIERVVNIARADARFAAQLRPALRALKETLDAVPLDSLPASAREQIVALRNKIDDFFRTERRNLDAHELAGGHTIERHVGRSENWLRNRLASDPDLQFASSFRNEAAANRAQGRFVNQNRAEIDAWLRGGEQRYVGEVTMNDPIGIVVERGRGGAVEPNRATVVLVRDNSPQGWHILTSYPVK
ncbi:MAG: RNase A-like domain-containing protein, partial [Pyrinomonadaceae bacterium]